MTLWRRRLLPVLVALLPCGVQAQSQAEEPDLDDLEGRLEYAYFTEDVPALRNLIRSTESQIDKNGSSPGALYRLALADFRLGQLLAEREKSVAIEAMADCIRQLDAVIQADAKSAEAFALQSACRGQRAGLQMWKVVIDAPLSSSRLQTAQKLAPHNPRVMLIDGLNDYERPKVFGGDRQRALTKFKRAVELFESSTQTAAGQPHWGHADAYAWLGRGLMESGDLLGARNALEQAVILAPEFAAAKRLLRQVTGAAR